MKTSFFISAALFSFTVSQNYFQICDTDFTTQSPFTEDHSFGQRVAFIGDVNRDGTGDICISSAGQSNGTDLGALHILLLNSTGSIQTSITLFDFGGNTLGSVSSIASIGDLNRDQTLDIAVSSEPGDIYILFLNPNGTLKCFNQISETGMTLNGTFNDLGDQGSSICSAGDVNLDGRPDLAIASRTAVHFLFLNSDGSLNSSQQIASINEFLPNGDIESGFGTSITRVGDINGDDIADYAVGTEFGSIFILLLNSIHQVIETKILFGTQGFSRNPENVMAVNLFGFSVSLIGDLNRDGVNEIAVGAPLDSEDDTNAGSVFIVSLTLDAIPRSIHRISLADVRQSVPNGNFGYSISMAEDINQDGIRDLFVGGTGRAYILFLDVDGDVDSLLQTRVYGVATISLLFLSCWQAICICYFVPCFFQPKYKEPDEIALVEVEDKSALPSKPPPSDNEPILI